MLALPVGEGLRNVRRHLGLSTVVVLAMGFVLLIAALILSIADLLDAQLREWEARVEIVAFLEADVTEDGLSTIQQALEEVPGVASVTYVSPEEAWRDFIAQSHAPPDLVSADEVRLLAASYTVRLRAGALQGEDVASTVETLGGVPGIAEVRYGGDLITRYAMFRRALSRATLLIVGGFAIALCGLSTAVLRLGMGARAATLRVWALEGASRGFLTRMLVAEGIAHGALASLTSIVLYLLSARLASGYLEIAIPTSSRALSLVCALGPVLGAFSALLATSRAVRLAHTGVWLTVPLLLAAALSIGRAHAAEVELAPSEPQTTEEFDVGRRQRELEKLRGQQERAHAEILRLADEGKSLLSQLESIGEIADTIHHNILSLSADVSNLDAHIGTLELQIGETQDDYALHAQEVARLSRLMEMRPAPTPMSVFFDGSTQAEAVRRDKIRDLLVESRMAAFGELERTQRTLRAERKALADKRQQALALQDTLAENMESQRRAREEKKALLTMVQGEQAVAAATVADLEQSVHALERLLERLQGGVSHYGPVPFPDLKGLLPWPIEKGKVTRRFGRRVAPVFLTVTVHDGWIVAPPSRQSAVQAVHDGVVSYADWLRGYGKLIILDHGAGYQTLYGHCAAIRVAQGDTVRAGDVLAAVGTTGPVEDPALYFGVRVNGTAQDPRYWLAPN